MKGGKQNEHGPDDSEHPECYELIMSSHDGKKILFRPATPEDKPRINVFWTHLSKESVYNRFFSYVPSVPESVLAQPGSDIDCRDMTMLALGTYNRTEQVEGMVHLFGGRDNIQAEIAVLIGDTWQHEGIGITLMILILLIAKQWGFRSVWGHVLGANNAMICLARKLGFKVTREECDNICEIKMDLEIKSI